MLSIVIPTRMRPETATRTLRSIAGQEFDFAALEIIVVVDGCAAGSADAVHATPMPCDVVVVEQDRQGQAGARNRGAGRARGEHLLFLDDDMVLRQGFLRAVESALIESADVALTTTGVGDWVAHTVTTGEARRWYTEANEAPLTHIGFYNVHFCATGARRAVFEATGGFDEAFTAGGAYGNEDIELGYRLLRAGADIRHAAGAVADTEACTDPDELMRRMTDVGRNDVRLARKHPELAGVLFGRKRQNSAIYRVTGRLLLMAPWAALADRPLRAAFRAAMRSGRDGPVVYRLWFTVRALRYWDGVLRAGGRDLVRSTAA